jgi:hypothetical protein
LQSHLDFRCDLYSIGQRGCFAVRAGDLRPQFGNHFAQPVTHRFASGLGDQSLQAGAVQQLVDRR